MVEGRKTVSGAFAVGSLQPTHHFRIDFLRRAETDLDRHRLVNLRRLKSSAGLLPFDTESEIDPSLCRGLHTGEGPSRRYERHVGLSRLDRNVTEANGCLDHRIEDRTELRTIRVLPVDELICSRGEEVRIAEPFHHQESLGVAGHALIRQPRAEAVLVRNLLPLDSPVPSRDAFPGPFFKQALGHGPHPLPIASLGQRLSPLVLSRSWNDTEWQEDYSPPSDGAFRQAQPSPFMERLREPAELRMPGLPPRPRSPRPSIHMPSSMRDGVERTPRDRGKPRRSASWTRMEQADEVPSSPWPSRRPP